MSSLKIETREALAIHVMVTADTLSADLVDGRTIAVPLVWYPRLMHATVAERNSWQLIGSGRGIHWLAVDEDISIANLLPGQPSQESQGSLKKWLEGRAKPAAKAKKRRGSATS